MTLGRAFGGQSAVASLRRVLVRAPRPEDLSVWRDFGWRAGPDPARIAAEHEAFCDVLRATGAEVLAASHDAPGDPDAIYVYDTCLVTDSGAIVLRSGKPGRRPEADAIEKDLADLGVPILARLDDRASADGGDMFFLDERTLLVGRSHRTNDAGIASVRDALPDVDVLAFDLPHLSGPGEVLHLMSLVSPLDVDLVVAFLPLLPTRLVELLRDRGVTLVGVPEEEFETMGPNALALGPRTALALEGSPRTKRRLEEAGVEVLTYRGEEISRKGEGGPTCLTCPILRG